MAADLRGPHLQTLGMLASALAGRPVAVAAGADGDSPWTDGQTVFVDPSADGRATLQAIAVQASMIGADSFETDFLKPLVRHPRVTKRYLMLEGHRALIANAVVLPKMLATLGDRDIADRSDSPEMSLSIASAKAPLGDPPTVFGTIRITKVLAASARVAKQIAREVVGHAPRDEGKKELEELDDAEIDDSDEPDLFSSPIGGHTFIGCLTIGASADAASLRSVFGTAAHATIDRPELLSDVIGRLFRSAVRAAEVRRRVS